mgnify:CR=1 FL=1
MIRGILLESMAKGVLIFSGFLLNIFLARKLGPSEYGIVGIITSILFFFELFLTNGIRQAVSKILSSYNVDENNLWKKSLIFQVILSTILIIIGILLVNVITKFLNIEDYKNYLYLLYAIIPLKAIYFLSLGFLNGKLLFKQHSITNAIYSLSRMVFSITLLILTGKGVLSILLGTMFAYLVSFFYLRKSISLREGIDNTVSFSDLINLTISALVFYFLINVFLNVDILLLRGFGTCEEIIGVYKANASIGIVVYYLFASILQVTYPSISNLHSQKLISSLKNLINTIFLLIFYVTSVAFIFTNFYSEIIISLFFGQKYLYDINILSWYVSGIGLLSLVIMLGNMLIVFEFKKYYLIYLFGSLCFFVFLTYLLYDYVYILSTPIALAISSIITILIFIYLLNKKKEKIINLKKLLLTFSWLIILVLISVKIFSFFSNRINNVILGFVILILYILISIASIKDIRISIKESFNNLIRENQ